MTLPHDSSSHSENTLVLDAGAMTALAGQLDSAASRLRGLAAQLKNNVARSQLASSLTGATLIDAAHATCQAWSDECAQHATAVSELSRNALEISQLVTAADVEAAVAIHHVDGK